MHSSPAADNTSNGPTKAKKRKRSDVSSGAPPKLLSPKLLTDDGIRTYLDNRAATGPFTVETLPLSRKRVKRENQDVQAISRIFEDRLEVQYNVRPNNVWNFLKKYKRFTVGDVHLDTDVSIGAGEYIFVKHDDWSDDAIDTSVQWKAIVLEVRAIDPEHVYILVAWLNRPEDLETGRKPYHGRNELIPTNHLDVIDAMSVNGRLDLIHWSENSDEIPGSDQYFWRQTYDASYTKTFSELERFCIENAPHNPDDMIVQCDQEDCKRWMHASCIAKTAARKANPNKSSSKKSKPVDLPIDPDSAAVGKAACDEYIAEVFIKDAVRSRQIDASDDEDDKTSRDDPVTDIKPLTASKIVISDSSGVKESQAVHCLLCQGVMA